MAKIKLVAIAKDEAAYLPEWIYHHLSIGVDAIDVYLNGITDNSFKVMRRICARHDNVNFFNADILMLNAVRAGRSFQYVVYRYAWQTERANRNFSHLAFLDIDEFLVPEQFGQNVDEIFVSSGKFDILSNLWYLDVPSDKGPFSQFFLESFKIQKTSVLKSVGRLRARLGFPMVHNFTKANKELEKLNAVLSDGTKVQYTALGKRISDADIRRCVGKIEPWFVFHRVFRSHDEYCASLMRGRAHHRYDDPIKNNRFGYLPRVSMPHTIGPVYEYKISQERCLGYQQGYENFIDECNLDVQIEVGRQFVIQRFDSLKELIHERPELVQRYKRVFRGTMFERQEIE